MSHRFQIPHKNILCCLLSSFFLSTAAVADDGHFYLSGSLGASRAAIGKTAPQIVYFGNLVSDSYPVNNNQSIATAFGLNGGYEFSGVNFKPAIAIGLGVYRTLSDYTYKGQLVESIFGGPGVPVLNYKYNILNTRLMAELRFIWILGKFAPFVNLGAGTAWTRNYSYSESRINNAVIPPPPAFASHTNIHPAFQAETGVSYLFNFGKSKTDFQHERISLGVRYEAVGDATFGTRGPAYPFALDTGRLTAYDLFLSFTHLF
jgi:hypothetical protein